MTICWFRLSRFAAKSWKSVVQCVSLLHTALIMIFILFNQLLIPVHLIFTQWYDWRIFWFYWVVIHQLLWFFSLLLRVVCTLLQQLLILFISFNSWFYVGLFATCLCQAIHWSVQIMQSLNDGTPEVRDAAFSVLAAIAKVIISWFSIFSCQLFFYFYFIFNFLLIGNFVNFSFLLFRWLVWDR